MSALWEGQLHHAKANGRTCNDWGYIRDEDDNLIMCVKYPYQRDIELDNHRREGTDPAQARVDFIVAAVNEAIKKGMTI